MKRVFGAAPLLLVWAAPLALALVAFFLHGVNAGHWQAMLAHPQVWSGLALSIWTGTAATLLSLILALTVAAGLYRSAVWRRLQVIAGLGLALPHLAFAIGFGFLIMPSGLAARLVVGGEVPPQWVSVQDPAGVSLIAALTLKEIPFFLAMMWSVLARGDLVNSIDGQWKSAQSLGHGAGSIWLRVVQPQLLYRLAWPIIIVWVYGATVVDMALVIGPTQPPTWAVAVWRDLNDADVANNGRGAAGALLLTGALVICGGIAAMLAIMSSRLLRSWLSRGQSLLSRPASAAWVLSGGTAMIYVLVTGVLVLFAIAARWPYPGLWPDQFRMAAVQNLFGNPAPLILSLGLGLATATSALAITVMWFETQPQDRDRWLLWLASAALGLPQIVVATGQYRLLLPAGMTATLGGLFVAHLTPVLAYVAIVLIGPYRGFDCRFAAVARGLGAGSWRVWWRVKAPLLRGPLLTAGAVGFAVSMVQFVPAQLMAAGRFSTLPMDAVTLSSGGNRALAAVYALALTLPPLAGFVIAGMAGRPRWR